MHAVLMINDRKLHIVKFPWCSDWLKQHALSGNKAWCDDIKLAFKFLHWNFRGIEWSI